MNLITVSFHFPNSKHMNPWFRYKLMNIIFMQNMSILQVNAEEITVLFMEHIEFLFRLMNQTNNMNNIYVRSIAARCLTEMEICFPASITTCSLLCLKVLCEEPVVGWFVWSSFKFVTFIFSPNSYTCFHKKCFKQIKSELINSF